MKHKRTPIGKFIHSSWTNMNIRAGKYRNNCSKNKCYEHIIIQFTREEYKQWCLNQEKHILSLNRPSVDRTNSQKNYTIDNIQIIELVDNIRKKKYGNKYVNGPLSNTKRGIKKSGNKWSSRIKADNKEIYLGIFNTKQEAYDCFYNAYYKYYGKHPW